MGVDSSVDVPIDINGDGVDDFLFDKWAFQQLALDPLTGGMMVVSTDDARVAPLHVGSLIGDSLTLQGAEWAGRSGISACAVFPDGLQCLGSFFGIDGYIGVQFPIEGEAHYGWIRLDHFEIAPGGTIIEWAFNDTPGESILAGQIPEPSTSVLIVAGLVFVFGRRWRINQGITRRSRATDGAAMFSEGQGNSPVC